MKKIALSRPFYIFTIFTVTSLLAFSNNAYSKNCLKKDNDCSDTEIKRAQIRKRNQDRVRERNTKEQEEAKKNTKTPEQLKCQEILNQIVELEKKANEEDTKLRELYALLDNLYDETYKPTGIATGLYEKIHTLPTNTQRDMINEEIDKQAKVLDLQKKNYHTKLTSIEVTTCKTKTETGEK